jgi:hypothetical protein
VYSSQVEVELKALGLRVHADIVLAVVQRYLNGETMYSLGTGRDRIVSKVTASKLKRLLDEGKLAFVVDALSDMASARRAGKVAEIAGGTKEFVTVSKRRERQGFDPIYQRMEEIRPQLPDVEFAIESLESAGISTGEGLSMMKEISELAFRFLEGEKGWSRNDLIRHVELHYIVIFTQRDSAQNHQAPRELLRFAAKTFATGLVDENAFMLSVGWDVLRYQIWRGRQYLEAFQEAQRPSTRVARRRNRGAFDEIDRILQQDAAQEDQNG